MLLDTLTALMPYSDFSLYAPTHETTAFPLKWGPHPSHPFFIHLFLSVCFTCWHLFAQPCTAGTLFTYRSRRCQGRRGGFVGSPGISHMRTGIAPSTFASDHPAKHIYSSKAFRKQADNIHWEKIIPLLALVLIWTQGLLISFYIEKCLYVSVLCLYCQHQAQILVCCLPS